MTNKIIDGIDVSGCNYYNEEDSTCDNENNHNIGCGQYDDCYYKQLQRAKKEIEDLKFYIDSYNVTWEINKYTEALKEIRKIARNQDLYRGRQALASIILRIINEVLND